MPSTAFLHQSLATWRRKHAYRQRQLDIAHDRNDKTAIEKWHKLLIEAGQAIRHREQQLASKIGPRERIVLAAQQAAANYRKNPGAYHYLAGGVANTIIMAPTPRNYRSDCSQFAANCYRVAGVPCPGSGTYMYSNTGTIAARGRITTHPKPGDLGLYSYNRGNLRGSTHHVEVYVGDGRHIGHGSPPIDSLTPGRPTFYLSFLD